MFKFILFAISLTFSCVVHACTCSFVPINSEATRAAKNVFIFRLIQAKVNLINGHVGSTPEIIGQIEVIDRLRGDEKRVKEIKFSTSSCCGSRFDVGSYFVAFVSEVGPRFVANNGNVVEIGREYPLPQTRANLLAVLDGEKRFEDVFSREFRDRTEQFPIQPPCPGKDRKSVELR
jgi:hypothetical protein